MKEWGPVIRLYSKLLTRSLALNFSRSPDMRTNPVAFGSAPRAVSWYSLLVSLLLQWFMKCFSFKVKHPEVLSSFFKATRHTCIHTRFGTVLEELFERTDKEKPLGPVSSSAASKFRDWYWPSRAYSLNANQMPFQNLVSQVGRRRLRTKFSIQSVATTHGNQLRRLENSILHVFDTNGHLVPRSLC